ncbi:MAG: 50S ribosomal protein L18 [archaeon]
MATNRVYKVDFRRKRDEKTDYRKRLNTLRSNKDRLVVRVTNNLVKAQIIRYGQEGDKTLVTAISRELIAMGWNNSLKSTPAVYLTTLLLCSKAKAKGIKAFVLDTGLRKFKAKNKIFASLKAVKDYGLECPHSSDAYPNEDRINGKAFGDYLKKNINADFEATKKKILAL